MKMNPKTNTFGARAELDSGSGKVTYYRLDKLTEDGIGNISKLPFSIKILLEAVLRNENGHEVTREDVEKIANYNPLDPALAEFPYMPARVLLQDFTGVPAVVDLAALRSAMARIGGDPERINPQIPVDLVIDHSVQVDAFGSSNALAINSQKEFERNKERYEFLHWGQDALQNFNVVPPASGICHQVNLEYLANVVQSKEVNGETVIFPDTLVGTDSHTTMINGIGVLGWGVGGIEAEAVMLGQPIYMLIPQVVGMKLTGKLPAGATATDMVLRITEVLRNHGVVGKFVEYFGEGISGLSVPDRATVSNMGPEYGATCGFFPVDAKTLDFLRATGRSAELVEMVERYTKAQGMFYTPDMEDPSFKETLELDLSTVAPAISGPKRPQDRIDLSDLKKDWNDSLTGPMSNKGFAVSDEHKGFSVPVEYPEGVTTDLTHGDVLIAAITSCTNTSNPAVLIGAGILAKKAVEAGLKSKAYVKTSLGPGSRVVTDYLIEAGLMPYLEELGFHVVGYGCTSCIGNSGPVPTPLANAVDEHLIVASSVLSGNRNFTGRVSPHTKASYLTSPPLVVAFALAGTVNIDMSKDPIGKGKNGQDVFLKDIWPTNEEIEELIHFAMNPEIFNRVYGGIEQSNEDWNAIEAPKSAVYDWKDESTYIQEPPFFVGMTAEVKPISKIDNASVLIVAGDSITTDHISPAGVFPKDGPAWNYLLDKGVEPQNFNSLGSRRGNDRVMTRATFANIMFRNFLADKEGGLTTYHPTGEQMSIYDAAMKYRESETPLVVLAGKDYGMGSSRDWAAKGTMLLGVKAVIAESFERIHRSNLVGMGVLPLVYKDGDTANSLGLDGTESFNVEVGNDVKPGQMIKVNAVGKNGTVSFETTCRLDTPIDVDYYRNGGILHTVLRKLFQESK